MTARTILALDIGSVRIGVAIATSVSRLPRPLLTLTRSAETVEDIKKLISEQGITDLVVGVPRGLDGQTTEQTRATLTFIEQLEDIGVPIHQQDEAVTSHQAKEELNSRGKPYEKGDIDALAATYILEDFLKELGNV